MWIILACGSAVFAGITSILAKCGIKRTDSDLATALRTIIVFLFSLLMVSIAGSFKTISQISWHSLLFLIISGIATGASWLCYFKALSTGDVNKVVPIDKSSTILSMLFAIVILGETSRLLVKAAGMLFIGSGTFLMIDYTKTNLKKSSGNWLIYALLSAVFAALTSILAKIGIENVESNLGTAIRTAVVLIMAWLIVFARGKQSGIKNISQKELVFIILSGIATGASWICYYSAIQSGIVSIVVPVDKLSILVSVLFSVLILKEKISKKSVLGLILIIFGTLAMVFFS
ncbi:Putative glucose uptake permease [uncultured Roseburia sp.]|uniref:EamA family transporter n=1 Tax=Brotonthovivens ammoniilytica TaxID=2981725 RepID=A0ABT2TG79_9FIRM|nr:EamA family transporter [Brotonthovivens ammoniilytica]MCU6761199.1 EamA family transporter [Brotonthovivens ammoniilytica]SCI21701.1 Putative glucose uptake permease [uncultured Roseburia sp.]